MNKDQATAAVNFLETLDPDKVAKGIVTPLLMSVLGAWAVKRNLRRLTGLPVSFGYAFALTRLASWLAYYAGAGYRTGQNTAQASHDASKDGMTR
jgi:hypothetical protein